MHAPATSDGGVFVMERQGMGRPKEPLIDVAGVVKAALQLIDEDGVDGLSMRKLGARLAVNPASLYNHFRNKEDILEAVRGHIVRSIKLPLRMTKLPWDEQLLILGKVYRAALTKHSNAAFLVSSTNPSKTRMMSHHLYDGVVGAMLDAGFSEHEALFMLITVEVIAAGSVIEEFSMGKLMRFGEVDAARFASLHRATRGKPLSVASCFPDMLAVFIAGAKVRFTGR